MIKKKKKEHGEKEKARVLTSLRIRNVALVESALSFGDVMLLAHISCSLMGAGNFGGA